MRLWAWLCGLWKRREAAQVEVSLFTRQGCHLCEEALAQLELARRRWRFRLTAIDIDADPCLVKQYGECVPVEAIDGRVRFRGRINPVLLTRLLRGISSRAEAGPEQPPEYR